MSVSNNSSYTTTAESIKDSPSTSEQYYNGSLYSQSLTDLLDCERKVENTINMKKNEETCCICAGTHLLTPCLEETCQKSFHLSCLSQYFPDLKQSLLCPCHAFKPLEDCAKLLNLANNFNSSDHPIYEIVKNEKVDSSQSDLKGKFFWFGISLQYFPYAHLSKPEFSASQHAETDSTDQDSWISNKILKTCKKLETVTKTLNSTLDFKEFAENPACVWGKTGENLVNSGKMHWKVQETMQKNYEKTQEVKKAELRNYHSNETEEKIVCAVCDNGESTPADLIIICAVCSVAVHSGCYGVSEIPDGDWLCDVCESKAGGSVCSLCTVKGGALKLAKQKRWVHVTCGKYLTNSDSFELDLGKIDKEKFRLRCFSCRIRTGACVQCHYGRCLTAFHVECRKDLLDQDSESAVWLCPQHKAGKLSRYLKLEQESSEKFIKKIAESIWPGFKKPRKRIRKLSEAQNLPFNKPIVKKEKTPKPSQLKNSEKPPKKSIIINIEPKTILIRVVVGDTVIRELNYAGATEFPEKRKLKRMRKLNAAIPETKIKDQEVQKKRIRKKQQISIMESDKEGLWIKMKVPKDLNEKKCRKIAKV